MRASKQALDSVDLVSLPQADIIDQVWRQAFGVKARDLDQHLLNQSYGLRRLLRFVKGVEVALKVTVPPTAVLRLGTPAAVSEAVGAGRWPESSPLLLLRHGVPGPALFIVAAGSGLVLELCDLAQAIDFSGPVWGLQLPGLDGECEPLMRVEDIADRHTKEILKLQLAGPAHLVGYSFGGLVALETAKKLSSAGQKIGLVGLIDSTCDERYWPRAAWLETSIRKAHQRLVEARAMPLRTQCLHVLGRIAALVAHVGRRVKAKNAPSGPENSIYYISGLEPDFQRVRNASIAAWESYKPRRTVKQAVLFKSVLGDTHACDPVAIWRRLIPHLETVAIPGSHRTILRRPYVQGLSQAIACRLAPVSRQATVRAIGSDRA